MNWRTTLPLLFLTLICQANAADWVFDFAYAWGGNKLITVEEDYYDDYQHSDSVRAGSGFSGSIGKMLSVNDEVGLQLNVGYKVDGLLHTETDATFDRWTFDALAWGFVDDIRFGIGATYEVNPELDLTDIHEGVEQFENAEGLIGQIDVALGRHLMFGVRYTAIEYESIDYPGEVVNGDNVSMRMTWWF
jgi:hypothetical protein